MDIPSKIIVTSAIIMFVITFILKARSWEAQISRHWKWEALAIVWFICAAATIGSILYKVWV